MGFKILLAIAVIGFAQISWCERCEELKNCVQCRMYQSGPIKKSECSNNCVVPIGVEAAIREHKSS